MLNMRFFAVFAAFLFLCLPGSGTGRAGEAANLIEDGEFEIVRDVNVGADKYVYDTIRDGADLTGGQGPIVRVPSNLSMFCGSKRLHIVEGTPGQEVHSGKTAIRLTGSYYVKCGGAATMGDVFQVRLYAKGDGAVRLILPVAGKEGKSLGQAVPPPFPVKSTDWLLVDYTIDLRDFPGAKSIGGRLEATGDVTIDDLSLTRVRTGAPQGAAPLPIAFARQTEKPPVIDGNLAEECWARALPNGPFFQINNNGKVGEPMTFFRVAFDDKNVYFGIEAKEPGAATLTQEQKPRDTWPGGSSVEFFMDTQCDRSSYYQLAADLAGTRYDARKLDSKWDTDWQVAVQKTGDRWTMEVAIPFSGLDGGAPVAGAMWGFNLCRNREGGQSNSSTWAKVGSAFHEPGRFNTLIFGTATDWCKRQLDSSRKNSVILHSRIAQLTPPDPVLNAKLAAADERLHAIVQPDADLSPYSTQFSSRYEDMQNFGEDFRAIDQDTEMAEAVQRASGKSKP